MTETTNKLDTGTIVVLSVIGAATLFSVIYISQRNFKEDFKTVKKGIDTVVNKAVNYVFSKEQENYLKQLHPKVQDKFRSFIRDIEQTLGYRVFITSGYRSFNEQIALKKENSANATAGFSAHNYGLSLDLNLIDKKGNWIRKSDTDATWQKTGVVDLAKKKYGMRWGGDFEGYQDPVHFDYQNIYDTNKLYAQAIKQFGKPENVKGNQVYIA